MLNLNLRVNDTESRISLSGNKNQRENAEIVFWNDDTCYTVAVWRLTPDGYNLTFIGKRPFDQDRPDFWKIARISQWVLDEHFELCEESDVNISVV